MTEDRRPRTGDCYFLAAGAAGMAVALRLAAVLVAVAGRDVAVVMAGALERGWLDSAVVGMGAVVVRARGCCREERRWTLRRMVVGGVGLLDPPPQASSPPSAAAARTISAVRAGLPTPELTQPPRGRWNVRV